MKRLPDSGPIWSAWANGKNLVGPNARPHSRVTVEPGYWLTEAARAGSRPPIKCPVRWYQRADNSQAEVEIPGLKQIQINESIDQDANTATITLTNASVDTNWSALTSEEFGRPGYLSPERGSVQPNRWGIPANEWAGLLGPNALLRTYQGYGGHNKTLAQCLADGNLVLTGVWLVDDPPVDTGGGSGPTLTLSCRNMAKLLVDQQTFPPLIPPNMYPLSYWRFYNRTVMSPIEIYGGRAFPLLITGIEGDGSTNGYWLVGNDGAVFTFGYLHFYGSMTGYLTTPPNTEYGGALFGLVGMAASPTGKGYWLLSSDGQLGHFGDAANHDGFVPITVRAVAIETRRGAGHDGFWVCDEAGQVYTYGDAPYCGGTPSLGVRKVVAMASTITGDGYWMCDDHGNVYSFGDAVYHGGAGGITLALPMSGMAVSATGDGYYLVAKDGGVFTYGDAPFYGSCTTLTTNVNMPNCNLVAGSTTVTQLFGTDGGTIFVPEDVGSPMSASYLPYGTTITSYISPTQVVVSHPASVSSPDPAYGNTVVIQRRLVLNDPVTDILVSPDGSGYWLAAEDGGVFTFRSPSTTSRSTDSSGHDKTLTVVGTFDPAHGQSPWTGTNDYHGAMFFSGSDAGPGSMGMTAGADGTGVSGPFCLEFLFKMFATPAGWQLPGTQPNPMVTSPAYAPLIYRGDIAGRFSNGAAAGGGNPLIYMWATYPGWESPYQPVFHLAGACNDASGATLIVVGTTQLLDNEAHSAALDYDGTTLRLFLDGVVEASVAMSGVQAPDELTPFMIGRSANTTNPAGYPFDGVIDELRLSTVSRHSGAYTPAAAPFTTDGDTLLLYHFDDLTGGSAGSGIEFMGSLPGGEIDTLAYDGNYMDFADIIKDLLLWSGFYLFDGGQTDNIYGNIETTGTYSPNPITADQFDKMNVVDAMHVVRDVVGYILYVDDEGAAHFHNANYWGAGNFLLDGTHTGIIPVIDERVQLTQYARSNPDKDIRSEYIISTNEPSANVPGTLTTTYVPSNVGVLKGMIRPAMWVNYFFLNPDEQLIMAQLIALHTYFQSRLGTVTCIANPMIQVNDQVQILERQSFETNVHYVRQKQTTHDLTSGKFTMQLTTNVLSPAGVDWQVTRPASSPHGTLTVRRP